jgi:hypothetical protein
MDGVITAHRVLAPEGTTADTLVHQTWVGDHAPAKLARPAGFPAGQWRRMSRLARMAAVCAAPLAADLDPATTPVVWGTSIGECVPTQRFLTRLFDEGPKAASPLAFQNSVYNAPAGHLSIALGLRGASETVSCGGATGLVALRRGLELLALGAPEVLVLAGADRAPLLQRAWELEPDSAAPGEAMAAVVLRAQGPGLPVSVHAGIAPAGPTLARRTRLPNEPAIAHVPGSSAPEACLGTSSSMGLACLLTLGSGSVVDHDGRWALTARIGAHA